MFTGVAPTTVHNSSDSQTDDDEDADEQACRCSSCYAARYLDGDCSPATMERQITR
jgi:hypothetical protein